jgi:hypothetical protein
LAGRLPFLLGVLLLAAQVGAIVYSRFTPLRYFCWAPFDQQTQYTIAVEIGGEGLTDMQIQRRYRRTAEGTDNRSAHHLFDLIERAEKKFEPAGRSRVTVVYRVNGGPEDVWQYPRR